jgi:hypothetical protein
LWEVWWFPPFLHAAKSWWFSDPLAVIHSHDRLSAAMSLVLNCRTISFPSVRRTGCLEGDGCVTNGLPPGTFHPPTLPHRCLGRGRSRLLAGHLLPSRHLLPRRFLVRPLRRLIWFVIDLQRLPLFRARWCLSLADTAFLLSLWCKSWCV